MRTTQFLFFDLATSGHHVEFLYHVISYRLQHPELGEFIFVTSPDFIECVKQLDAKLDLAGHGVKIVNPSDSVVEAISKMRPGIRCNNAEFEVFCAFVREYQPQRAFVMYLNKYQHALGRQYARRLNCEIRAILFNPLGPIAGERLGLFTALRKRMQIRWMLRNRNLKHIYILNDVDRADYLNQVFDSQGLFASIPDPVLILPTRSGTENAASEVCTTGRCRFLLFGALSSRKGIFIVLDAMRQLPTDIACRTELMLAGKVVKQQQDDFSAALAALRNDCPALLINHLDAFIPYNQIPVLFSSALAILVPYAGTDSSSGVLGHAALYKKRVIGTDQGLIGKLIRQYDLGIAIPPDNAEKLAGAISSCINSESGLLVPDGMQRYIQERHPDVFAGRLLAD